MEEHPDEVRYYRGSPAVFPEAVYFPECGTGRVTDIPSITIDDHLQQPRGMPCINSSVGLGGDDGNGSSAATSGEVGREGGKGWHLAEWQWRALVLQLGGPPIAS